MKWAPIATLCASVMVKIFPQHQFISPSDSLGNLSGEARDPNVMYCGYPVMLTFPKIWQP